MQQRQSQKDNTYTICQGINQNRKGDWSPYDLQSITHTLLR